MRRGLDTDGAAASTSPRPQAGNFTRPQAGNFTRPQAGNFTRPQAGNVTPSVTSFTTHLLRDRPVSSGSRGVKGDTTSGTAGAGALLARLGESYVRRADPAAAAPARLETHGVMTPPADEGRAVACTVLAVAAVDDERRWVWPAETGRMRPSAVALRARPGRIEVHADPGTGTVLRSLDSRGRLRLPIGVLRWSGLAVGDRLALVAHGDVNGQLFLVPTSDLLAPSPGRS